MKFSNPEHEETAEFDLTPMIDVVMLLIIFFAFTSQFTRTLDTPVDLPREVGDTTAPTAPRSIVIDLTREGRTIIMGRAFDADWLVQTVSEDLRRAGGPEFVDIIVRADRACPAVHLNALAGTLSRAGVRTWKLAAGGEGP